MRNERPGESGSGASTAADSLYDNVRTALATAGETLVREIEALKRVSPSDSSGTVNVPGLGVQRAASTSDSVAGSVAFRSALRDVLSLKEQLVSEEFAMALEAADALRERVHAEVRTREAEQSRARDTQQHEKQSERQRIASLEERLRLADSQCDLLRNSVARRNALLAEQRSAYYRDLLGSKGPEMSGPPPAPTYEAMIAGAPVAERPNFFDAMIFETLHLAIDVPYADKAATALKLASSREADLKSRSGGEAAEAKREALDARKRLASLEGQYREQMAALEASVNQRIQDGIDAAIADVRRQAREEVDLAWERVRELEGEAAATRAQAEAMVHEREMAFETRQREVCAGPWRPVFTPARRAQPSAFTLHTYVAGRAHTPPASGPLCQTVC